MKKSRLMEQSKVETIVSWILQILLAGLFVMSAIPKLTSDPELVGNFTRWGMPGKIYLVIGFFELLGAIGLLIPRVAAAAAVGLMLIMVGALFTHLTNYEWGMAIVPLVVTIFLAVVAYLRNPLKKKKNVVNEL